MTKIIGTQVYDNSFTDAVTALTGNCSGQPYRNSLVSATGAHGLVHAKKDDSFAEILRGFYMNLPDGMPAVWIGRLKGAKEMERCYGPDFFKAVMTASADQPIRHFFCGGKEGVAEELKAVCEEKFGNFHIIGVYSPPFRDMTDEEVRQLAQTINSLQCDIVWIGLSTPKQEILARRLAAHTQVHFIITVGAAFDFHTGRVRQAPRWVQRGGLEWFFRLCMEPRRLYKRYCKVVPLFIFYNLAEGINHLMNKFSRSKTDVQR